MLISKTVLLRNKVFENQNQKISKFSLGPFSNQSPSFRYSGFGQAPMTVVLRGMVPFGRLRLNCYIGRWGWQQNEAHDFTTIAYFIIYFMVLNKIYIFDTSDMNWIRNEVFLKYVASRNLFYIPNAIWHYYRLFP